MKWKSRPILAIHFTNKALNTLENHWKQKPSLPKKQSGCRTCIESDAGIVCYLQNKDKLQLQFILNSK